MNAYTKRNLTVFVAGSLSAGLLCGPALAQTVPQASPEQASDPAAQEATGLEDVVVTAERREGSVQRTPAAITSVSGENLASRGVTDLLSAASLAPSVHVNNYSSGVQIVVRGVYAQSPSPSADPAIAFNLDGIYLARPAAASAAFYDVSRIEVLRGPQGTLYGRNATGGSFNLITNKPTQTLGGRLDSGVGNYGLWQTTAVANIPLSDTLAFRGAFNLIKHAGYTDNAPVEDGNDQDSLASRVQLLWKPTDTFDLRLIADYSKQTGVGPAGRLLTNRSEEFAFALNTASAIKSVNWGTSAEANWDLGPVTLTYVGGYRALDYVFRYDNDYSTARGAVTNITQEQHQVTNELRLSSNGDGPLKYIVGAYQFFESSPYNQTQIQTPSVGYTLQLDAPLIEARAYALFGQATYSITDRLRVTGGLRYTVDDKKQEARYLLNGAELTNNSGQRDWDAFNYKVGAEFDLTPSNLLYANISTAYKAGGINQSIPATTYEPEELLAYTVGSKNRFLDNNLQVNVEAFYYDYQNYHGALSLGTPTVGGNAVFTTIANAKKAEVYGIETEAMFRIGQFGQLDGYVSLLHTEFKDYVIGTTVFTGNQLAKAPEVSYTIGYQHEFPLGSVGSVTARAELHHEGDQFLSPTNAVTAFQPAYSESNAFVRFDPASGGWYANAWVRNIEDEVHLTHVSLGAFINNPRTYGLTVGVNF